MESFFGNYFTSDNPKSLNLQEELRKMSSIFLFPANLFVLHLSTNSKNWSRFPSWSCEAVSLSFLSHEAISPFILRSQLWRDGARSRKACEHELCEKRFQIFIFTHSTCLNNRELWAYLMLKIFFVPNWLIH